MTFGEKFVNERAREREKEREREREERDGSKLGATTFSITALSATIKKRDT